jgi:hypothetical protein
MLVINMLVPFESESSFWAYKEIIRAILNNFQPKIKANYAEAFQIKGELEGIKSLNPITEEEKNRVKPL